MKTFKTRNTNLATFLIYEGVELLKLSLEGEKVVFLTFFDPHGKCLDLERVYLSSREKVFEDTRAWLLSKIHEVLSGGEDVNV